MILTSKLKVMALQAEEPCKHLAAELAAAKMLESKASQELELARPGDGLLPSLRAAAEARADSTSASRWQMPSQGQQGWPDLDSLRML